MPQQQPGAFRRQDEAFHAAQRGQLAYLPAIGGHGADVVVDRAPAVAQEVEAAAIGRQPGLRSFPAARGQLARARVAIDVERVELRPARFLGQVPQRAVVRHPAEIVEVPVDPGVVVQPVAGAQAGAGGVHRGDPAILVVDRAQQHRDVARIAGPVDRRPAAVGVGLDAHVAIALQRILACGLAQRGERVVLDPGQGVERQLARRAGGDVDQPQRVRQRRIAADPGMRLLELLVARLGDVLRQLAGLAGVGAPGGDAMLTTNCNSFEGPLFWPPANACTRT